MSLSTLGRSSVFWASIDKFGTQFFQFLFSVVLARLLSPDEFGIVGILMAIIALLRPLMEGGLDASLIQNKKASVLEISSVFWLNLLMAGLLTLLLWALAPLFSAWFADVRLTNSLRVLSLMLVGEALALVQYVYLYRKLAFKTLAIVSILSILFSGAIGIVLALQGWGYWSLVYRQLAHSAISSLLLWWLVGGEVKWLFSLERIRHHLLFGYKILLSGLLNKGVAQLYPLLIGKLYTPAHLAYYGRAQATKDVPVVSISAVVGRVFFPLLSRIQDDPGRIRRMLEEVIHMLHFGVVGILLLIALTAEEIVLLLFTEKWMAVAPLLQLVVLAGVFAPVYTLNSYVLVARGRPGLNLKIETFYKVFGLGLLGVTAFMGLEAIILGQALAALVAFLLSNWYLQRSIGFSFLKQLLFFLSYAGSALLVFVLAEAYLPLPEGLYSALLLKTLVAGGGYLVLVSVLSRARALKSAMHHIKAFLKKDTKVEAG